MTTSNAPQQLISKPIFLVGSERSGSTLLRLMLDNHPDIALGQEFNFVVELISDDGALPPLEVFRDHLRTVRGMDYAVDPSLGYRKLVNDFLKQKQRASGNKPLVGATVHHHFDRLLHLWPDARFVHLLRDPRAVAKSVVQKGWAGNVYHAAEWWKNAESCWDRLVSHLPPDRYIEVRYEDLVCNPRKELTRICEFLHLAYHPSMLEYSREAPQYPKPDPKLAWKWKAQLSRRDIGLVEAQTGDLLVQRGYEASSQSKPVVPLRHELLMLESKVLRLREKVQRFGLGLVCLDVLGRRLRIGSMASYAARGIRAIESDTLAQEAAGLRAPSANIAPTLAKETRASEPPGRS